MCAVVLATAACASIHSVPREAMPSPDTSRHLLASAELRSVEGLDAFEAIRRLKPSWLTGRGVSTLVAPEREGLKVYLDGMPHGDLRTLKRMSIRTIEEIRLLDSRQATTRYGIGHPDGALEISTRRGFVARR